MTLDEAITHAREIAGRGGECAEDHEQLAEWLEELRKLRAIAATLGIYERTCKMYREYGKWHCTACERGADVITGNDGELDSWIDSWAPNYCPYCGRRGEQ